jgi:phage terminase large subunit GpA-like protein
MLHVRIANAERLAAFALADAVRPPQRVEYESWAVRNLIIHDGDLRGPYDPRQFPFWSEVLRALGPDDPCRTVTLAKSAQIGGTVLGNIFALGKLDVSPGAMGFVHPSGPSATIWAKTKFDGMLALSNRLRALFPRAGEPGNSTDFKQRRDGRGSIEITGAVSAAGLSQRTWEAVVMDDLSKWENNEAGDPETQAETRAQAIEFAKLFKISTPLVDPGCRITRGYRAGTMERYEVRCPHCEAPMILTWANMLRRYEEGVKNGRDYDIGFTCDACGAEINEHHRAGMINPANGARWVAQRPERMRVARSFWIWAAYGPLMSWRRIIDKWLDAVGDPGREQVFINDVAGLPFDADSKTPEIDDLVARSSTGHARGTIPAGHWLVYAGADVQEDRVEVHVRAFGPHGRAATVEYIVIPHPMGSDECRARLNDILLQTWPHACGTRIAIDKLAIDAGYEFGAVASWAKRHPVSQVIMTKGLSGQRTSFLTKLQTRKNNTGKPSKSGSRLYGVAVDDGKLHVYARLKVVDRDLPSYQSFPVGLGQAWFEQLVSERRVKDRDRNGFEIHVWKLPPGKRNEVLDTTVYADAAACKDGLAEMTDTTWDRIAAERGRVPEQADLEDLLAPSRVPSPPPAAVVEAQAVPQGKSAWTGARSNWMNR